MFRRRRPTGAAISLFSFQDIITSVTAIMILLVLILTLELVQRSLNRGVAAEDRRVARDLRAGVESLERQAEALRAEVVALQSSARQSAEFSESETRRRQRQATTRAAELAEEIDLLETRLRTAAADRRRSEAELVADRGAAPEQSAEHVAAMQARAEAMEQANAAERDRQQRVRREHPGGGVAPTLVFNVPPGEQLAPRLLEVAGDGLTVMPVGGAEPLRFSSPGRDFTRWLGSLDRSAEYVVLILRPSGVKWHMPLREALETAGVSWGMELVGEAMPVTLGEGG